MLIVIFKESAVSITDHYLSVFYRLKEIIFLNLNY